MVEIAVIHRCFGIGGGESVCFHILEALQDEYNLHLYCLNKPEFKSLNESFATDVRPAQITVHTPSFGNIELSAVLSATETATKGRIGSQGAIQLALMQSAFREEWEKYDLRLTTHGELPLSSPAIQYIHYPFLNRWRTDSHFKIDNVTGRLLNRALTKIVRGSPINIR